jgi:hypothetical protein
MGQGMGSPVGSDPLIPLLQELRERKEYAEPFIISTLQKIVTRAEHERERGSEYSNVDRAIRKILARPLTNAESELVGRL